MQITFQLKFVFLLICIHQFTASPAITFFDDNEEPPLITVPYVDLNDLIGVYYTIAELPIIIEKFCHCPYVNYTWAADKNDTLNLAETCHFYSDTGPLITSNSEAYPTDSTNAKLINSNFYGLLNAPYWIIDLDEDYQWLAIGQPSRQYYWILSRTPQLDQNITNQIIQSAINNGYNLSTLEYADQSCWTS